MIVVRCPLTVDRWSAAADGRGSNFGVFVLARHAARSSNVETLLPAEANWSSVCGLLRQRRTLIHERRAVASQGRHFERQSRSRTAYCCLARTKTPEPGEMRMWMPPTFKHERLRNSTLDRRSSVIGHRPTVNGQRPTVIDHHLTARYDSVLRLRCRRSF